MINEIVIQTRITKKPLRSEGRFVEVVHIRLLLNGVTLYETNLPSVRKGFLVILV